MNQVNVLVNITNVTKLQMITLESCNVNKVRSFIACRSFVSLLAVGDATKDD